MVLQELSPLPEYLQSFARQLDACPLGITASVISAKNGIQRLVVSIKSFMPVDADDFGIYEDGQDGFTSFKFQSEKIKSNFGLFLEPEFFNVSNVENLLSTSGDDDLDLFTQNADPELETLRVTMLNHLRVTPLDNVPAGYLLISEIKRCNPLFSLLPDYVYTGTYIVPLNYRPLSFEMYGDSHFVDGFTVFPIQYAPQ